MTNEHRYYVSCLYGNWSVFRDGIQFAANFENEEKAKEFMSHICKSRSATQ